jgi:hypothetical protein
VHLTSDSRQTPTYRTLDPRWGRTKEGRKYAKIGWDHSDK